MKIVARDIPPRTAWALEQAGVHPLLARLYAARGVQSKDELDDGLARLLPPINSIAGHGTSALTAGLTATTKPKKVQDDPRAPTQNEHQNT